MVVSTEIEKVQQNAKKLCVTYADEVKSLEKQLASLQQPQKEPGYGMGQILKGSVKWAVLGGAVGVFLGCVWVLVTLMMCSRAESSRQMEKLLQLPFLGSVAKNGDIFNRVARKMLGERCWRTHQQAADYITENLKALPGDGDALAILTTLPENKLGQSLEAAETAASGAFQTVYTVADAERNPQTARILSQCSRVLLAERVGTSETQAIRALMETAQRLDAKVEGFIVL
jgi:hypothetical protein